MDQRGLLTLLELYFLWLARYMLFTHFTWSFELDLWLSGKVIIMLFLTCVFQVGKSCYTVLCTWDKAFCHEL